MPDLAGANVNTHWDAATYERIAKPHGSWAERVMDDLALRADEVVLDAGCGGGGITMELAARVPQGRVYGVDASAEMMKELRQKLAAGAAKNIIPVHASLTNFSLPEQVDAVFSNAVFHWIMDDDALFGCLYRATKPSGRLRAQCGGAGNLARLMQAVAAVRQRPRFADHLRGFTDAKKYRSAGEAAEALRRTGWTAVDATLFDAPVSIDNFDEAALFISTIILRDHLARLPQHLRDEYSRAVIDEFLGRFGAPFTVDYVRLDLAARRP